jgi:hypothetical protein
LNGSFRPKLSFVFSEIEGTVCEGFANENDCYCRVLAVSKGRRGGSIFDTPFETRHVKASPEFQLREYHQLPRQCSTRPASVYKSNPPGRKTGFSAKYARRVMRACAQLCA